jgi:hypothetical protein
MPVGCVRSIRGDKHQRDFAYSSRAPDEQKVYLEEVAMYLRPMTWILRIVMTVMIGSLSYLFTRSEAYQLSMSRLQTSSEAADVLGSPISTRMPSGSFTVSGPYGTAVLNFSVTGPKAAGRLFVEACKTRGVWSLSSLILKVEGRDGVIDLLKSSNVRLEFLRWHIDDYHEGGDSESGWG